MTPSQVLRATADILRRDGWCQKFPELDNGRKCILGALSTLKLTEEEWFHAHKRLADATGCYSIASWNDAHGRTFDEVLSLLERAAEIGEPEKRRVLIPAEVPAAPLTPDNPIWFEPAPEEPKRIPEKVPA